MTAILSHSDEVSGTTVLDDGTRVYWTEGRSSDTVARLPDGQRLVLSCTSVHPLLAALDRLEQEGADEHRKMTPEEEHEWAQARYPDGRIKTRHLPYAGPVTDDEPTI